MADDFSVLESEDEQARGVLPLEDKGGGEWWVDGGGAEEGEVIISSDGAVEVRGADGEIEAVGEAAIYSRAGDGRIRDEGLLEELRAIQREDVGKFLYVMGRAQIPQPEVKDVLAECKLRRAWYRRMTRGEREYLEELARRLMFEYAIQAKVVLTMAARKAAEVKVKGLESEDEKLRQAVATEVLDRTIGKADSKPSIDNRRVTLVWSDRLPPVT